MATTIPYIQTLEKLFQEEISTITTDYAMCMRLSRKQPQVGANVILLLCETSTGLILGEEEFFCPNSTNLFDQVSQLAKLYPIELMELTTKFLIEASKDIAREEENLYYLLHNDSEYCEMN